MAVSAEQDNYTFPPAPSPDAVEWDGSPIGLGNVVTRTKGRTQKSDKSLDKNPQLRSRIISAARAAAERAQQDGTLHQHDVVVHGVRVRALTNSQHLLNLWRDNWYSPEEWAQATGAAAPHEPRVTVYAFGHVEDEDEAAYYSQEEDTVVFFNTSYYGQLKSWVLGAVGRVLANEFGIHSIHGACVAAGGRGVLYIAPTGTGKSTSSYGLMSIPGSRFHSDDWVYVHYTFQTRTGERVSPYEVTPSGGEPVRGYRCLPWLRAHADEDAEVKALRLNGESVTLRTPDLDLSVPMHAYAYISEKVFYLRTNLVESFPAVTPQLLGSKLENVPDVSPDFVSENQDIGARIVEEAASARGSDRIDAEQASRLFAFDNSRAMLNISDVFGPDSVYLNPMEPVQLDDVFLLKRDFTTDVVLERLPRERFMNRLVLGYTPAGKKEVAYNAYRAVDDPEERHYIDELEKRGGSVWSRMAEDPGKPQSLAEEFTLFEALYDSADCYDLNTILTKDPQVSDKAEAVDLTIQLIASVVHSGAPEDRITLDNYRQLIAGS